MSLRGWSRVGHGSLFQNPTQPKISGPNPTQPTKVFTRPNPTQPIIDTWYSILGYTKNFIQQLLHVTDKFTVRMTLKISRSQVFTQPNPTQPIDGPNP